MTSIAKRTIAAVAIVVTLGVGTPVMALAGTTTTTTVPAITTLKQYHAAEKVYRAKLKDINLVFLAAVNAAKADLTLALDTATNSTQRISARATYRYEITEATIARANALSLLGNPPVKPDHKYPTTTTTS
jgi:hypothetical protein